MPNSNSACQPPYSACEECFGPAADLPRFLYLVGPPPINQVLEGGGLGYAWTTSSGAGWPHAFDCLTT
ncbi:hypothetical protein [Gimesia aquarii]|uniref:Uncharacterized protein n=1 Tax=Gimesia aquarii TaxID=2527964 RepID=A0A517WZT1_9PLAN|nr:hypothetical protein [Gimesia aquarii]QDU10759.1 hypothetical protein V202x_41710 [Gimesia aquarii]